MDVLGSSAAADSWNIANRGRIHEGSSYTPGEQRGDGLIAGLLVARNDWESDIRWLTLWRRLRDAEASETLEFARDAAGVPSP
jgi:hypothetical protein